MLIRDDAFVVPRFVGLGQDGANTDIGQRICGPEQSVSRTGLGKIR